MTKDELKLRKIAKKYPRWRHYIKTSKSRADRKLYYIRHYKAHVERNQRWNKRHKKQYMHTQRKSLTKKFILHDATNQEVGQVVKWYNQRKKELQK